VPEAISPTGVRRAEPIMGTAFSLDVRDAVDPEAVDAFFARLRHADSIFSTYRADSQISRLNRGDLALRDADPAMLEVLARCAELRARTGGYFDARASAADGGIDPSGLVKGWATERAARLLEAAGARNYCISAGGDVIVRGERAAGLPWRIGLRHPERADTLATVLHACDLAVASSGNYERGRHVIDPNRGRPADQLLAVSVAGPSLADADAYATAAFAMGHAGLEWIAGLESYAGLSIGRDRVVRWTPGLDAYLA
jgi:thiamine biosynthesis lipoprotein